ncbi:MAG: right-handed parallel beta-helix repeat-containing protein, partial [Saprospiraceae bacterium]|nr:right-handed parallel beta-helix repeat-containing protein [Saprospiraceae bacterium]
MKQILLTTFVWLQLLAFNHAQTYQDTTFTDPVVISFAPDFVTFNNCRFVGIDGVALYIEGSGVLVSDCTFENINSTGILAFGGEVYLTSDTFSQINGSAIIAEFGAMIVLDCSFSDISR